MEARAPSVTATATLDEQRARIEQRVHQKPCGDGRFDGKLTVFPKLFANGPGWVAAVGGNVAYYTRDARAQLQPSGLYTVYWRCSP